MAFHRPDPRIVRMARSSESSGLSSNPNLFQQNNPIIQYLERIIQQQNSVIQEKDNFINFLNQQISSNNNNMRELIIENSELLKTNQELIEKISKNKDTKKKFNKDSRILDIPLNSSSSPISEINRNFLEINDMSNQDIRNELKITHKKSIKEIPRGHKALVMKLHEERNKIRNTPSPIPKETTPDKNEIQVGEKRNVIYMYDEDIAVRNEPSPKKLKED